MILEENLAGIHQAFDAQIIASGDTASDRRSILPRSPGAKSCGAPTWTPFTTGRGERITDCRKTASSCHTYVVNKDRPCCLNRQWESKRKSSIRESLYDNPGNELKERFMDQAAPLL